MIGLSTKVLRILKSGDFIHYCLQPLPGDPFYLHELFSVLACLPFEYTGNATELFALNLRFFWIRELEGGCIGAAIVNPSISISSVDFLAGSFVSICSPCSDTPVLSFFSTITSCAALGCGLEATSMSRLDNLCNRASSTGPNTLDRNLALFAFLVLARRPLAISPVETECKDIACRGYPSVKFRWANFARRP